MPTAVITMAYNEPVFLPLWIDYYGKNFGPSSLFVIDHGSNDGVLNKYGEINKITLPRSVQDDTKRTAFVSEIATSLLKYYDTVIYTDSDEFIVPDPRKWINLREYVKNRSVDTVTAIGLNVVQKCSIEEAYDPSIGVLSQRKFVRLCSPMSKPVITSSAIRWSPGFHGCEKEATFENLFLFHLRYFDLNYGLERLERSRNHGWSSDTAGRHQRVEDTTWRSWFSQFDSFEIGGDLFDESETSDTSIFKRNFISGAEKNRSGIYTYKHDVPSRLITIPQCFQDSF